MTPVKQYQEMASKHGWILAVLVAVLAFLLIHAAAILPGSPENIEQDIIPDMIWPEPPEISLNDDWTILQSRNASAPAQAGSAAKLLRLAGTFLPLGNGTRKAIFDNLVTASQSIVGENSLIENIKVLRIYRDRVVVRSDKGEEQLWLSFSDPSAGQVGSPETNTEAKNKDPFTRFGGKQVGERSFVLSRKALVEYYSELMDNPRRLLNVFNSLKPVRTENGAITGYYLGVEGEKDFFDAVQLKEGDIVRSVNSMPMTNRRRAEYFIAEFVNNRANAFVMEVERGDKKEKLVYHVRE